MYALARRLLFTLEPELAHSVALHTLQWLRYLLPARHFSQPVEVMGLTFPNRVGLSAGLDKNGDYIDGLAKLGFGHIEIGTITPKPQPGNPKPRIFRLPKKKAVINRMGFNNKGVDALVENIKRAKYGGILGINIGKNKDTPLENAQDDYLYCYRKVYPYASYVTVNLSSPNTPGLRQLQFGEHLKALLDALVNEREKLKNTYYQHKPLVVKIAPDMAEDDIEAFCQIVNQSQIEGVIATNTTTTRDGVQKEPHADEAGGLSGKPLLNRATQTLKHIKHHLNPSIALIGVGGIMGAQDACEKFQAGADLVQIYTGFIYEGPELIKRIATLPREMIGAQTKA